MTLIISVFNASYIYLQGFIILPTLTSQEMLETVPTESSSQGDLDFDVLSKAHGHLRVARREGDVHWSQHNKNAAFAWTWSTGCNGIKLPIWARALLTNFSMIQVTFLCFCSSGKLSTWQILQKPFIIIDHFYVVLFTSLEQTVWFNWWSACGLCSQLMTSDTKLLSVLGGSSTSL